MARIIRKNQLTHKKVNRIRIPRSAEAFITFRINSCSVATIKYDRFTIPRIASWVKDREIEAGIVRKFVLNLCVNECENGGL